MSKTSVTVAVDRKQALRQGINGTASPVQIEIDVSTWSQEDRDDMADRYKDGVVRDTSAPDLLQPMRGYGTLPMTVIEPTEAGLLAALRLWREQHAAAIAKRAAACEQRITEYLSGSVDSHLTARSTQTVYVGGKQVHEWIISDIEYPLYDDPRVKSYRQQLQAEADRRNLVLRDRQDYERREKAARRARWIEEHGSKRLKRLVAEGIDHDKTYDAEVEAYESGQYATRLSTERPGWRVAAGSPVLDVSDVGERSLALLDAARLVEPTARLGKYEGRIVAVAEFHGQTIVWPNERSGGGN